MNESSIKIAPIPPRGALLSPADERRPDITTRGPFQRVWPFDEAVDLRVLVEHLRGGERDLSLTFVVSVGASGDEPESLKFFGDLFSIVADRHRDAIWVVASKPASWGPPPGRPLPVAALLDSTKPLDARIAGNLIADLLFLPAADASDDDLLRNFLRRTSLVVLPRDAARSEVVAALADDSEMLTLHWGGMPRKLEKRSITVADAAPGARTALDQGVDLAAIGSQLTLLAKQLTAGRERRSVFRTTLAGVLDSFPFHPRWNEDLLDLADQHKWPAWAVQTLPALYLRISEVEDQHVTSLVWYPLLEWVDMPERYRSGTLCGGEIWRVRLPLEIDQVLVEIHDEIKENLRGNPYHGDSPFFARISDAIDAVAQARKKSEDPAAKRLRELSFALPKRAQK